MDMHYPLEIGIVLTGVMRRQYRDWEMDVHPGGVWLCGMWEPHGCRVTKPPCTVRISFVWPSAILPAGIPSLTPIDGGAMFSAPPGSRPQPKAKTRERILALSSRLDEFDGKPEALAAAWHSALFRELLLLLVADWTSPTRPRAQVRIPGYTSITPAIEMAFESRRLVPAQTAARACGMCLSKFNRVFTALMGVSFPKFDLRHRLSLAKADLLRRDMSVKQVAVEWGFADASHFCRCFRQHYGCAPAQYVQRGKREDAARS